MFRVDFHDFLHGRRDHERRGDSLLDGKHDAFWRAYSNGGGSEFDRLHGVLHLEQPTFGTEGVNTAVVLVARLEHGSTVVEVCVVKMKSVC